MKLTLEERINEVLQRYEAEVKAGNKQYSWIDPAMIAAELNIPWSKKIRRAVFNVAVDRGWERKGKTDEFDFH